MTRNDGSYYAEGRTVFKAPLREPREDGGADITIGFPVCTASEWVTKEAPQTIADALNAARSPAPQGGEADLQKCTIKAEDLKPGQLFQFKPGEETYQAVRYAEEEQIRGLNTRTHIVAPYPPSPGLCIYLVDEHPAPQPDPRDELLREARDALQAAQRFIGTEYEMIADDGEMLAHEARPTYEQVTATLMKFQKEMGDE